MATVEVTNWTDTETMINEIVNQVLAGIFDPPKKITDRGLRQAYTELVSKLKGKVTYEDKLTSPEPPQTFLRKIDPTKRGGQVRQLPAPGTNRRQLLAAAQPQRRLTGASVDYAATLQPTTMQPALMPARMTQAEERIAEVEALLLEFNMADRRASGSSDDDDSTNQNSAAAAVMGRLGLDSPATPTAQSDKAKQWNARQAPSWGQRSAAVQSSVLALIPDVPDMLKAQTAQRVLTDGHATFSSPDVSDSESDSESDSGSASDPGSDAESPRLPQAVSTSSSSKKQNFVRRFQELLRIEENFSENMKDLKAIVEKYNLGEGENGKFFTGMMDCYASFINNPFAELGDPNDVTEAQFAEKLKQFLLIFKNGYAARAVDMLYVRTRHEEMMTCLKALRTQVSGEDFGKLSRYLPAPFRILSNYTTNLQQLAKDCRGTPFAGLDFNYLIELTRTYQGWLNGKVELNGHTITNASPTAVHHALGTPEMRRFLMGSAIGRVGGSPTRNAKARRATDTGPNTDAVTRQLAATFVK